MLRLEPTPQAVVFDTVLELGNRAFGVDGHDPGICRDDRETPIRLDAGRRGLGSPHERTTIPRLLQRRAGLPPRNGGRVRQAHPAGRRPAAARGRPVRGPARRAAARGVRVPRRRGSARRSTTSTQRSPTPCSRSSTRTTSGRSPSMAIVQFPAATDPTKLVAGHPVPRGTRARATRAVDGQPCQFRTAYPVTLWPIAVESAVVRPRTG